MYVPATLALGSAPLVPDSVLVGGAPDSVPVGASPDSMLVSVSAGGAGESATTPEATAISVRRVALNVLAGQALTISGALLRAPGAATRHSPGLAGGRVLLQVRLRGRWRTLAGTHTGARGRYRLRYRPPRIGSELVRMRFPGDAADHGSHRLLGRLDVFHIVGASWYGGGGSLACGGWLTSSTLGVANKTLPCGTRVTLRYDGRTIRVPVIDRGPYVAGREFDLTEATKRALGFEGAGEVWATA